ncbi:hypothetical protein Pla22_52170 [Rubripirellula amarantea]|uniref:Uncharacterized protein n=1 Tax=Rubripirellula amarantea TaxID=2527999 RepID=A0A5C5WCZ4_9BACT|nr:hypothetical protein Pla22_52170 [Rubripirellula amarantea]
MIVGWFDKATPERRIHYLEVNFLLQCPGQRFAITPERPGSQDGEPWSVSFQLNGLGATVTSSGLTLGLRG